MIDVRGPYATLIRSEEYQHDGATPTLEQRRCSASR
jgi:hypothetical protein